MTEHPTPEQIGVMIDTALQIHSDTRPRTVQSAAGIIGPSDLGWCRNAAALKIKGTPQSDARSTRPADIGTAIHTVVEEALNQVFPEWLTEPQRVTATFRTGGRTWKVTGTPDIVIPEWNMVLDIKTVDGYSWVKRNGASQSQRYQRHTYAKACAEEGILDGTKPLYVGNVWVDRSGREAQVYVGEIEECRPETDDEIALWLEDVTYAVENGEDAQRDIAPEVCAQLCEFFTVCRGHLPDEQAEVITDPGLIDAAAMYEEGRVMEKRAKAMKDEAKALLDGHSGIAGNFQVRWTTVGAVDVPGYLRDGYTKIAVVPVRRRQGE